MILTGLTPNTTYEYQLQGALGETMSEWSVPSTFTTQDVPAPTGLAASEIMLYSAKLNWTENGNAEAWVVAYKAKDNVRFTEVSVNNKTFTLEGLTPGTQYTVKVSPVFIGDFRNWSDEINFTTDTNPIPSDVTVIPTTTTATISWTGNGQSYNVRYKEESATDWTSSSTTQATAFITGLTPNTTYEYQIQSYRFGENTEWTAVATFTTLAPIDLSLANNAEDNSTTISSKDGESANATLTSRTLYTDGDWNTLCLPFNIDDLSGTPLSGFAVKELDTENKWAMVNGQWSISESGHATSFDNGTLYLNFRNATSIEAGKPYIVRKLDTNSSTLTYTATSGTTKGSLDSQHYTNFIDGSIDTYWRAEFDEGVCYCEFEANSPVLVTGYTLTTGNQVYTTHPTVWTMQAKKRKTDEWTIIDSRDATTNDDDALPSSPTRASKTYTIDADKQSEYKYFRFEATQSGGNAVCMAELTIINNTAIKYTATKGTDGIYNDFGYANLIDGYDLSYWRTEYSNSTSAYAYCKFNSNMPVQVTGYTLTSSNVGTSYNPKVWTLKARLYESDEWTVIDSRDVNVNSGDALSSSGTVPKDYAIAEDKQGAYRFFLFEVTENGGASQMCLSGLDLHAAVAGTPKNIVSPTFTEVFIEGAAPTPVTFTGGRFAGTYDYQDFTEENKSILFLGAENTLYYPEAGASIGAFRAYFQLDTTTPVRTFHLNFGEGEASGIDAQQIINPQLSIPKREGWYTIDGRKLDGVGTGSVPAHLRKGIYIHNGRKVVIK
jgi:hypothetical protein